MNRDCVLVMLGILVHNGLISLPAADHYMTVLDKMLEDGDNMYTVDMVLGALNG
jgi:hypothetical protein